MTSHPWSNISKKVSESASESVRKRVTYINKLIQHEDTPSDDLWKCKSLEKAYTLIQRVPLLLPDLSNRRTAI